MTDEGNLLRIDDLLEKDGLSYGIVQPGGASAGGIPMLRVVDLEVGATPENVMRVHPEIEAKFRRSRLKGGELLLTVVGSPGLARVATPEMAGYNVARAIAVLRLRDIEPEWVALAFETSTVRHQLASLLNTTVQATLNLADVRDILIPVPDASLRRGILSMLGALDEKIAVNRRVQKSARDLARVLAERQKLSCLVGDLASASGSTISPERMDVLHVNHFSLPAFDQGFVTVEAPENIQSSKFALEGPVVLVSKLNPRIPRIWAVDILPEGLSVSSTEFVPLAPNADVSVGELWAALLSPKFTEQVLAHVAGTTGSHQRIRPADLLQVPVTDVRAIAATERAVLRDLCRLNNERTTENQCLTATRGELLPLLMTGRITIKEAENLVEREV